jgi:hypothetical protein
MARRLDSFPVQTGSRYPWSEWLDGTIWELTAGADFSSKVSTFRANVQTQAKKRGGRARSRAITSDGREAVVIQFERD